MPSIISNVNIVDCLRPESDRISCLRNPECYRWTVDILLKFVSMFTAHLPVRDSNDDGNVPLSSFIDALEIIPLANVHASPLALRMTILALVPNANANANCHLPRLLMPHHYKKLWIKQISLSLSVCLYVCLSVSFAQHILFANYAEPA